jgi:hypothetical protein
VLAGVAADTVQRWLKGGGAIWHTLLERIAELPAAERERLALDTDQSFFWGFAHRLAIHDAQTAQRLDVLGAAAVPVACYGNLRTGVAGVPANLVAVPGHIPFGPALAAALARHPITIDVTSPGFINTVSQKVLHGFNAGGFILVDRKSDFVAEFGELGEAVSYKDGADLAAKINLYLSRPRLRQEVGDALRARFAERHTLTDVLRRVIDQAAAPVPSAQPPTDGKGEGSDVLGHLRRGQALPFGLRWPLVGSLPRLDACSRGVELTTQPHAWRCAATIALPQPAADAREPRLWLTLQVTSGKLGVAVLAGPDRPVVGDQWIGPSRRPVTFSIDLPRNRPATVVFRSVVDNSSSAFISRLLYDQGAPDGGAR